jgi:hypothetical protein
MPRSKNEDWTRAHIDPLRATTDDECSAYRGVLLHSPHAVLRHRSPTTAHRWPDSAPRWLTAARSADNPGATQQHVTGPVPPDIDPGDGQQQRRRTLATNPGAHGHQRSGLLVDQVFALLHHHVWNTVDAAAVHPANANGCWSITGNSWLSTKTPPGPDAG